MPRDSSTWLGSREPEVQAEPEEPQTPQVQAQQKGSPSIPSKHILKLPAMRLVGWPFKWERSILERRQSACPAALSAGRLCRECLLWLPLPRPPGLRCPRYFPCRPGGFFPGRRRRSGSGGGRPADIQGAAAFGTMNFMAGKGHQVNALGFYIDGHVATAWTASVWNRTLCFLHTAASSGMG